MQHFTNSFSREFLTIAAFLTSSRAETIYFLWYKLWRGLRILTFRVFRRNFLVADDRSRRRHQLFQLLFEAVEVERMSVCRSRWQSDTAVWRIANSRRRPTCMQYTQRFIMCDRFLRSKITTLQGCTKCRPTYHMLTVGLCMHLCIPRRHKNVLLLITVIAHQHKAAGAKIEAKSKREMVATAL